MYNAFISYSHAADGKLAPALQAALEKFAKPWYKLRNLDIFRDEDSLSASPHLWENIKGALSTSEYLVYLASPQSADSKWVKLEIEYWLEHKSLDKLLIVLTDGEILWDDSKKKFKNPEHNSLPEILENKFDVEPYYIDLRASKTEVDLSLNNPIFKKEVLKLAAHLHGKAPHDLASKAVMVHRNMMLVRNSAIVILVLLLSFSILQTIEAKNQTNLAEEKTKAALTSDSIAQERTKAALTSDSIAQIERKVALDSSKVAQEQREIAKQQRDSALFQEQIAIKEQKRTEVALAQQKMANQSNEYSQTKEKRAIMHAMEAEALWNLLDLLGERGIKSDAAVEIIQKLKSKSSNNQDYQLYRIENIEILSTDETNNLFKINFLGQNNESVIELDSLVIASFK